MQSTHKSGVVVPPVPSRAQPSTSKPAMMQATGKTFTGDVGNKSVTMPRHSVSSDSSPPTPPSSRPNFNRQSSRELTTPVFSTAPRRPANSNTSSTHQSDLANRPLPSLPPPRRPADLPSAVPGSLMPGSSERGIQVSERMRPDSVSSIPSPTIIGSPSNHPSSRPLPPVPGPPPGHQSSSSPGPLIRSIAPGRPQSAVPLKPYQPRPQVPAFEKVIKYPVPPANTPESNSLEVSTSNSSRSTPPPRIRPSGPPRPPLPPQPSRITRFHETTAVSSVPPPKKEILTSPGRCTVSVMSRGSVPDILSGAARNGGLASRPWTTVDIIDSAQKQSKDNTRSENNDQQDFEARFSFRDVDEFPDPEEFIVSRNIYPSIVQGYQRHRSPRPLPPIPSV